jgi:predicted enzyme related to lactoylglutathione lyase
MGNPVAWFEIVGKDGEKLRAFYHDLFDWQIYSFNTRMDYGLVPAQPKGIGGGIGRSEDSDKGHVTFYVEVEDSAGYLARAEKLGGHDGGSSDEGPGSRAHLRHSC